MIHKPNKPADTTSSYRPISLLPFLAKILEKLILKRILPIISDKKVLPDYQFGFRSSHSTTHQLHRVVDAISFSLEKKLFCTAAFLDISQAFDRVWHDGLLHKLKTFLPSPFYLLIKSYLTERTFQIRYGSDTSSIGSISAGVPQGGILSPILYNIFAADQPITPNTSVADYADDKVIISMNDNPFIASSNLQTHLDLMENWYTKWRFKLNHSKSIHTTFTLRPALTPEVTLYGAPIPSSPSVKYLGLTLDKRLTWAHHIREKRLSLNNKFRILKPLVSNKHISLHVKLLIYKTLLKPIWTYGIQLWGRVPQGSKISPILFNLYISDFPTTTNTEIALYADDSVIYSSSDKIENVIVNIQSHLDVIQIWAQKWKIVLNPTKSTAVIFSLRRPTNYNSLKINGHNIPWSQNIKYLGVILDKKLTWNPHISSKVQQGYQRLKILYPLINRQTSLSWKCSILLYKQIIRPLLLYAVPVWGQCAPTHINKIQVLQSKVLRVISNAPWFVRNDALHTDFNLPTIKNYIKDQSASFFCHLRKASGPQHYRLNVSPISRRLKRGRPHDILK
ncbi:hypothetical protein QTP88_021465 [Uroleucon formosanum]